jgi:hypothetical protein
MALTPNDILRISEPVEMIYSRTVDELLVNIARHFTIGGWDRTRYWEIKKLAEMGALTKESAAIIAKNTGKLPEEIEAAFLEVSKQACLDIDPELRAAAAKGLLQDPGTDATTSPLIRATVQAYVDEAVDKMNMVNTTLLQSTRQAYLQGVTTAVAEAQLAEAQRILDTQALAVAIGQETRVRAIRKAMDQMSAAGLTGFVDRAGRNWSPEAYAAMVVRTASHNVAIRAVKDRQQEFGGGDIFQVSSHPGARPLCYPYQGKFYSWSTGPGEFKDGAGHTQQYDNIHATSYGEPAGLFGINCGHHPIPMIPGYSYPQEYEEQSEEENRKEYEESQQQRAYERNIRAAKREQAIAEATGDTAAKREATLKVREEQRRMQGFINETGRARRYDREQIADGSKPRTSLIGQSKPTPAPANSELVQALRQSSIAKNPTTAWGHTPTSEEIIAILAGGDKTTGSCSSLGFAYIGNRAGQIVRDFRGGESCSFFSRNYNINRVLKFPGVEGKVEMDTSDLRAVHRLTDSMEQGREYYLATGRHAAMIRKTESGLEYLEMQSYNPEENTWKELTDEKLRRRFKAQKSHTIAGQKYEARSIIIDAESLYSSPDFAEMIQYINTAEGSEKKGFGGGIK